MRDYKLYIHDIIEASEKIINYVKDLNSEKFKEDTKTYDSVLHNLMVIGEAANKIPEDFKQKHLEIDWRAIIGMRNIIAHGYFTIDSDIIWDTIQKDIPELLSKFKEIE